jgi:adenylate cyclase
MIETSAVPAPTELDDLLDGLDGRLRAGRQRLLVELLARGYTPAELREAHGQDRLAVLLLQEALHESALLSARDLAALCEIDLDDVLHATRMLGLPADGPDQPAFDELMCESLRTLKLARSYGLSEVAIDGLMTALRRHMRQLTADMEVIVGNDLGRAGDTEYELAHRYADAASVLAPTAAPLVSSAFTGHLRERMRDIFVTPDEAEVGALRAVADVAVGFVDIVGFTGLGERVDAGELKSIAMLLVDLADDAIGPSVRLVKTVGDAIMLVSRDADALVESVVGISVAATAERALPAIHSGIAYGAAHLGGADVYGVPVNVASRVTDLAPPAGIWATEALAAMAPSRPWTSFRAYDLKGCAEPVAICELDTCF